MKDNRLVWNVYFAETQKLICKVKANTASEAKIWARLMVLERGYKKEMLIAEVTQ